MKPTKSPAAATPATAKPELTLTTVALTDLRADPANPRTHDARNLAAIAASLREHGQVEPLLVQAGTMMVIGGNGRAEAMRSLGWTSARVAMLEVNDIEARKLSIALNRTGELAGWDESVLAQHLADLSALDGAFDVEGLGFSGAEMEALLAAYTTDVEPAVLPPPPPRDGAAIGAAGAATGGLDPHTVPSPMPSSGVRLVQLFLDDGTIEAFQMAVRVLAERYGTDNITDTVRRAVLAEAGNS